MRIEKTHNVGQQEAKRRIDTFLDELMQRELPAGIAIKEPSKTWTGNEMAFSFKAKKGWVGSTLSGTILVSDQTVVLNSELPGLVTTFVSEEKIRAAIGEQLDSLLA